MCVQCAMGAMTAGVAATGMRAWFEVRVPAMAGMTGKRTLKTLLAAAWIVSAGLLGSG
jgi:hypothetical protein